MMASVRTNLVQNVPYSGASRNKFVGFSILLGVIYFVLDPHLIRGRPGSGPGETCPPQWPVNGFSVQWSP